MLKYVYVIIIIIIIIIIMPLACNKACQEEGWFLSHGRGGVEVERGGLVPPQWVMGTSTKYK